MRGIDYRNSALNFESVRSRAQTYASGNRGFPEHSPSLPNRRLETTEIRAFENERQISIYCHWTVWKGNGLIESHCHGNEEVLQSPTVARASGEDVANRCATVSQRAHRPAAGPVAARVVRGALAARGAFAGGELWTLHAARDQLLHREALSAPRSPFRENARTTTRPPRLPRDERVGACARWRLSTTRQAPYMDAPLGRASDPREEI